MRTAHLAGKIPDARYAGVNCLHNQGIIMIASGEEETEGVGPRQIKVKSPVSRSLQPSLFDVRTLRKQAEQERPCKSAATVRVAWKYHATRWK